MGKQLTVLWACLLLAACQQQSTTSERQPQQAGKPLDPVKVAGQIASIRGSAALGDQDGVRKGMKGLQEDFRKSIKLADPARRVDRESARVAARRVEGVRSVVWIDHENLFALVDDASKRSHETIDDICLELEPLGDTLGVVVNLQNATAKNGDELEILSRNCQLAPGDRAFMQRNRQVDVISPELRAQYKATQLDAEASRAEREEQAEAMRIIEASTPEL